MTNWILQSKKMVTNKPFALKKLCKEDKKKKMLRVGENIFKPCI
jgi:hypothetical protein